MPAEDGALQPGTAAPPPAPALSPGGQVRPTTRPRGGSQPSLLHEPRPARQTLSRSGSRGGGRPRTRLRPARPRAPTCGCETPRQGTSQLAGADEAHAHGGGNAPDTAREPPQETRGRAERPPSAPHAPEAGPRQLPGASGPAPGTPPHCLPGRSCRGASRGPAPPLQYDQSAAGSSSGPIHGRELGSGAPILGRTQPPPGAQADQSATESSSEPILGLELRPCARPRARDWRWDQGWPPTPVGPEAGVPAEVDYCSVWSGLSAAFVGGRPPRLADCGDE